MPQSPAHRAIWILITAVQIIEMEMIDRTECAIGDHFLCQQQCRHKAIVEYHRESSFGRGSLSNFLRFNGVARKRFIHDDMFARAQRGENNFAVREIRGANVHHIHIFAREERFKARRPTFESAVLCCALRRPLVRCANRGEFEAGKQARIDEGNIVIGKRVYLAYHSVSDEANTNGFRAIFQDFNPVSVRYIAAASSKACRRLWTAAGISPVPGFSLPPGPFNSGEENSPTVMPAPTNEETLPVFSRPSIIRSTFCSRPCATIMSCNVRMYFSKFACTTCGLRPVCGGCQHGYHVSNSIMSAYG